ncbi:MAG: hypothetical protein WC951_12155 [Bacteroidales bacterium]
MKNNFANATYVVGTILVIIGTYMKLNFIEYGLFVLFSGVVVGGFGSHLNTTYLKKRNSALEERVKELEQQLKN